MFIIEKQLKKFSSAHRLTNGYQGKCRNLHGHNYKISVTLCSQQLDQHDLLIDFSIISELFDAYVQDKLDHGIIVSDADEPLLKFARTENQKYYLIDKGRNTSVEVLAQELYLEFTKLLQQDSQVPASVTLHSVKINETDTAWAAFCNNNIQSSPAYCGDVSSIRE